MAHSHFRQAGPQKIDAGKSSRRCILIHRRDADFPLIVTSRPAAVPPDGHPPDGHPLTWTVRSVTHDGDDPAIVSDSDAAALHRWIVENFGAHDALPESFVRAVWTGAGPVIARDLYEFSEDEIVTSQSFVLEAVSGIDAMDGQSPRTWRRAGTGPTAMRDIVAGIIALEAGQAIAGNRWRISMGSQRIAYFECGGLNPEDAAGRPIIRFGGGITIQRVVDRENIQAIAAIAAECAVPLSRPVGALMAEAGEAMTSLLESPLLDRASGLTPSSPVTISDLRAILADDTPQGRDCLARILAEAGNWMPVLYPRPDLSRHISAHIGDPRARAPAPAPPIAAMLSAIGRAAQAALKNEAERDAAPDFFTGM